VHTRTAAALGVLLLALVVPAGAAQAGPAKKACRVIPDDRGDEQVGAAALLGLAVPGTPADDLLSADVASDGRTLTAVMRMADLPAMDPAAPLGRRYTVLFHVGFGEVEWFVTARTTPSGAVFTYGRSEEPYGLVPQALDLGLGRGVVDTARREVRVHVPGSAVGGRRGARLVFL
jgi:hypothetical protein